MASEETTKELEMLDEVQEETAAGKGRCIGVASPDEILHQLETSTLLVNDVGEGYEAPGDHQARDLGERIGRDAFEKGCLLDNSAQKAELGIATDQIMSAGNASVPLATSTNIHVNIPMESFSNGGPGGDSSESPSVSLAVPSPPSPLHTNDISQGYGDLKVGTSLWMAQMKQPGIVPHVDSGKKITPPGDGDKGCQSRERATDEPRGTVVQEDGSTILSPPSNSSTTGKATFSGALNSIPVSSCEDRQLGDGDDTDSDSDGEICTLTESIHQEPRTDSQLILSGDGDELEVDTAVAEEIRASLESSRETPIVGKRLSSVTPLLIALEQADDAAKQLAADVMSAHASKLDDINLGSEAQSPSSVVLRPTRVIIPPPTSSESSKATFGIGYQSLKKLQHSSTGLSNDSSFAIHIGRTLPDLENELTISIEASLSQVQVADASDDDFDFAYLPDSTIPCVAAILEKQTTPSNGYDAELLNELKRVTDEERQYVRESGIPQVTSETPTSSSENGLTMKELYTIYKRGLGDQGVLLLDNPEVTCPESTTSYRGTNRGTSSLSVMGKILSSESLATNAIVEEDETDSDGESASETQKIRLNCGDGGTMAVESEQGLNTQTLRDTGKPQVESTGKDGGQDEWREIQLLHKLSTPQTQMEMVKGPTISQITYPEAEQHFLENDDVLSNRDRIVSEEMPLPTSCFSCFSRPRLTFGGAMDQRDRFFCIAATTFDPHNVVHVRMLQTIYRTVTKGSNDVPLMGAHWDTIGFQGNDPSTDLRGCGVLSLLQMLYFVETHPELAHRFHILSQHPTRHFPMACALINVTLQCLVALRSGALYRECNKRNSIFDATNMLYVAITTQLTQELQSSTEEIPVVMKRVLDFGRGQPERVIETNGAIAKHCKDRLADRSSYRNTAAANVPSSQATKEFTEIGQCSVGDE